ncbi:MAG: NADH-quinone oxidoreductase subunit D [Clostridia bacterium]|nr:NADH-quinone oxidoreductase subunit D [Clostridia bacterium]
MKEVKLFVGPQHPGMHGNASIHMYVDGDIINRAYLLPGMLHRGFEKSMEKRTWMNNIALIPRICVPEPDTNEMVYAMNIEALANIEVPERAHWIRMLVLELARLAIHLMAFGGCGGPTGLYTAMYWAQADRDGILELFEEISGQRIYHMYIVAGGVRKDLPKGIEKKIIAYIDDLEARLPDYEELVLNNPSIRKRLVDNIILPKEVVWELGVTGIGMRSATGEPYDLRKVTPYARYDKVEFDVPTATYSDAQTRMTLKYLEMYQTIRIIRQVLDMMPKGKVRAKVDDGSALRWKVPAGQVYSAVEASRGEYGYYTVSTGELMPYRVAGRGASFPQGLLGLEKYLPGHRIDDAPLWFDTMGICSPEIDR